MDSCEGIVESVLERLRLTYGQMRFFTERDIVWTLQGWIREELEGRKSLFRVFNDFPMLPGPRRSLSADLAIVENDCAAIAIEFKYEPSHLRKDIWKGKFPVVSWNSISSDVQRIQNFVEAEKCRKGYAILVDEGQYFRNRSGISNGRWEDWDIESSGVSRVSVHICETGAIARLSP